ncbi:MAG: DUF2272 domain-containing protein [Rhodospirillales bacterium]
MKSIAALLLSLLLIGCAAQQTDFEPPRRIVPPEQVKAELLRLADQEWRAFGRQVVRHESDRIVVDPVGRHTEDDRAVYERMTGYWNAVGDTGFSSYQDCEGSWQRVTARKCPWHLPWSAAFISWLMLKSGVTEFQPDASHAIYLQPILAGKISRLVARNIAERAPQPGDLICSTRGMGNDAPTDWHQLIGKTVPMHCDLVTANRGSSIEAIGGNVFNAVSKSIRPAREGLLDRASSGAFVVIVENRYPVPGS